MYSFINKNVRKIIDENLNILDRITLIGAFSALVLAIIFLTIFRQRIYIDGSTSNSGLYLLSALVQSLASVLALILTLSLIAIQMSSQAYSPRILRLYIKSIYFTDCIIYSNNRIYYFNKCTI